MSSNHGNHGRVVDLPLTCADGASAARVPRGTAMRTLLDEQLEAAGTATDVAIETAHVASVIPLVLAGAGVAILSEGMAAEAAAKGAPVVRLDPPTRASVSLMWRPDRLGAVAEHFVMVASESRPDRDA